MKKRMTIEIDEELLARAKQVLGQSTIRATIEEALRRAIASVEREREDRAARQRRYFETLSEHLDLEVLASDEMWR
jgi:Arc/MetJ family transcription regulator